MRDLAPGSVVAGYRIESLVGRGGMGIVYRAVQLDLDRVVALKVIAPELLDDDDVRARFLTEARAAASVDHPNVIPVHAAGEDDGIAYIAMRFVAGDDLRSLVRYGGPFDPAGRGGDRRAGRRRAGRDPPGRVRAPRRQAGEPAGRPRQPRLSDRLRAGEGRVHPHRRDAHRSVGRDARLRVAGADPRRADRRARRCVRARRRPALRAHRPRAVRARGRRGEVVGAVVRAAAGAVGGPARAAGRNSTSRSRARWRRSRTSAIRRRATSAARHAPPPLGRAPTRAGADGGARRRRARRGADGAGAGRRGLDPHRGAVRREALAPPPRSAAGRRRAAVGGRERGRRDGAGHARRLAGRRGPARPTAHADRDRGSVAARGRDDRERGRPPGRDRAGRRRPVGHQLTPAGPDAGGRGDRTGARAGIPESAGGARDRGLRRQRVGGHRRRDEQRRSALDARTGKERSRIQVPASPRRLAVDGSGVWVGTGSNVGQPGMVLRYDLESGDLLQRLDVREGVGGLLAAPGTIWVVKRDTNKLARMSPGATVLDDWATLPGRAMSLSYADPSVWVVLEDQDTIVRVGARDGQLRPGAGGQRSHAFAPGGRARVRRQPQHQRRARARSEHAGAHAGPDRRRVNPYALVADEQSIWVTGLGDNTLTRDPLPLKQRQRAGGERRALLVLRERRRARRARTAPTACP